MTRCRNIFIGLLSAILYVLPAVQAAAQNMTVTGVVKDSSGEPLAGVSVLVAGTKTGTVTGFDGDYKLTVAKGKTLIFSFIGFETLDIKVDKAKIDVVMNEEALTMETVVVTGYSSVELRKSTGAVAVIGADKLKDNPLKTVDQLLQGQLAGVDVKITSGRPGAASKVRIRGTNTITGNAEPLWVIDGVPMQKNIPSMNSSQIKSGDFDNIFATGIGSLNPNDIESITVLKDASAAAIYGSQAANGVIVVTTKHGAAGKASVSYSGSVTVQTKPSRSPDLMNSQEKLAWEQELWDEFSSAGYELVQNGISAHYPIVGVVGQIRSGYGRFKGWSKDQQDAYIAELGSQSTDWFDVLFRNTVSTSHYLSVSGGSDKLTYYVSGGYGWNNGVVVKTNSRSANFSSKIDTRPAKWIKFGVQTDFSYQKALAPSNNVNMFKYAYFANPYEQLYNADGSYRADDTYFTLGHANRNYSAILPDNGFNIMRDINETSSDATSSMFTIMGNTTVNIAKGLNFTGLASFSYNGDMSENINGKDTFAAFEDRPFEKDVYSKRTYGSITQMSSYNTSYILRGQLNYSKTFAEWHNINAIAGAEVRSSYAKSIFAKRYGYDPITGNHANPVYPSNGSNMIDYEQLQSYGKLMDGTAGQSILEDAFASFYGTATYNYRSRYIVSGTVRSDGSNNFGSDEQFNLNWSVSGAWNIDQESWMQSVSNVLSSLGLRAGFGYTGGVNKSVSPVLIMSYSPYFRTTDDDYYRVGAVKDAPNPNLRWEKNRTMNLGLAFGFLNDRITGEVAWYHNKNLDQVTEVRVPHTTGFNSQSYNTSEQINTGLEVTLGATLLKINDFTWRITANAAYNYNELTRYDPPVKDLSSSRFVGYPLGKIFTGKTTGINPKTGLYEFVLRPDVVIRQEEDYKKSQNYLFYIGTSNAPWTGGFSTSLSYRNFSVNLVGNVSLGGKVVNDIVSPASYNEVMGASGSEPIQSSRSDLYVNHLNVVRAVTNRWTESNPRTDAYPRLVDKLGPRLTDENGNLLDKTRVYSDSVSDCVLLEDVSYLKFSSISLSYSFPEKWVKAMRVGGLSASFLMNNLFTITNYSGIDPETPGAVYPQSRSFTFSMSLSF
jgi:iron complex outermembrane receptor protein